METIWWLLLQIVRIAGDKDVILNQFSSFHITTVVGLSGYFYIYMSYIHRLIYL
jgi:hypothetical protein